MSSPTWSTWTRGDFSNASRKFVAALWPLRRRLLGVLAAARRGRRPVAAGCRRTGSAAGVGVGIGGAAGVGVGIGGAAGVGVGRGGGGRRTGRTRRRPAARGVGLEVGPLDLLRGPDARLVRGGALRVDHRGQLPGHWVLGWSCSGARLVVELPRTDRDRQPGTVRRGVARPADTPPA